MSRGWQGGPFQVQAAFFCRTKLIKYWACQRRKPNSTSGFVCATIGFIKRGYRMTPIEYVLDHRDRIISVGEAWDHFADENGGMNVSSKDVIGRPLWDFVAGDTTRMWLETLFGSARLCGRTIERPYRCDSPNLKRFMQMRIGFEQGGILRIEHKILATEKRSAPVHFQYRAKALRNTRQRCSICGRVKNGNWHEPIEANAEVPAVILVVYTVCEDCRRIMPGR